MRILLTGGAGYVGSACLRWLERHGHEPVAFDDLSEGNRESVPADRLVEGNILDRNALADAMTRHRAEAVMHFAALASVPDSIMRPDEYWQVNVQGTKCVLDAMQECGVKRIVFSSSAATYSFSAPMPILETSDQLPQVPYGTTKLAGERIIADYARAYGFGFACLRYFNASGADPDGSFGEDRRQETHVIPLVLLTAVGRRDEFLVYGADWPTADGSCVRDFVHTDDLAAAHQLALETMEVGGGEAFNVGLGRGYSVLEVIKSCERAVGRSIRHRIEGRRPGDPAVLVASSAKLRAKGWAPRFETLDEIVDTACRWHTRYPHGYADKVGVPEPAEP
jgi:UDP-glucose 4-epimerase